MKNRKKVSYLALRLSKNQKTGTEEMAQQGRGCTTLAEDLISVTAPLSDSSQLPSNSSSMGFSTFFWPPRALTQVHKPTFRHIYIYTDLKKKTKTRRVPPSFIWFYQQLNAYRGRCKQRESKCKQAIWLSA